MLIYNTEIRIADILKLLHCPPQSPDIAISKCVCDYLYCEVENAKQLLRLNFGGVERFPPQN